MKHGPAALGCRLWVDMRCIEPDCDQEAISGAQTCLAHEPTDTGRKPLDHKRQRLEDRIAKLELGIRGIREIARQGGDEDLLRRCRELLED